MPTPSPADTSTLTRGKQLTSYIAGGLTREFPPAKNLEP